jgi:hypothetical protein
MIKQFLIFLSIGAMHVACGNENAVQSKTGDTPASGEVVKKIRHFAGPLSGGLKGDSIFFDINAAGTKLENLTFKGYWRCSGKLEMLRGAGPDGSFTITNNKVDDYISEPPNGGSTAWRFDLTAMINGNKASGTFRMNINGLGCNTGKLSWTAVAK